VSSLSDIFDYLLNDLFDEEFKLSPKEAFSKVSIVDQPLITLDSPLV
jgi:hypothetical protein